MGQVSRIGPAMVLFGILLVLAAPAAVGAGESLVPLDGNELLAAPIDLQAGAQEGDDGLDAASPAALPPIITLWYGSTQYFGALGNSQLEINILGNATKIQTLSYRLNGIGFFKPVALGRITATAPSQQLADYLAPWESLDQHSGAPQALFPDGPTSPDITASPRLEYEGDFNVEILTAELQNGINTLELKGVGGGGETIRTVTIHYTRGNTWPLPYYIDWSQVGDITQVAQIVDGDWELSADGIRPKLHGYDRMIALGDIGWTDFQVSVPVTIYSFPEGDSGGVGIVNRWQGHFQVEDEQPGAGWWSIGAYGLFLHRNDANGGRRLIMYTGRRDPLQDTSGFLVNRNKPYIFKLRVQTKGAGQSGFYSFKVWAPSDGPEPEDWVFEAQDAPPEELFSGGAGLIAHDVDASFGNVEILPLLKVNTNVTGNGSVNVSPSLVEQSDAYVYGDQIQLQAVAQPGWAFSGWSGDVSGNANPMSVTLMGDLNATATFVTGQAYDLDVTVSGGGQVDLDPAGPSYLAGTVVKLTPVADEGWEFNGWSGADAAALSDNHDGSWSVTMSQHRSLASTFVKKQYSLTVNITGSGSVSKDPDAVTYEHGTEVELTANAASGWDFSGWSGDLTGGGRRADLLMDGPKTVTAYFRDDDVGPLEYDSHTIDDDQTGGSDGNNNGQVDCGETIELVVAVENRGTVIATGINAALSTDSPYVTWPGSSTSSYPDIAGAGTQSNTTPFRFKAADNTPGGHTIDFDLTISSTNGGLGSDSFQVEVACAGAGTLDRQVNHTDDDAEERDYGKVYLFGTDLELVEDDDGPQTVALRFQNVTIPKGASIAEAYLEFTADEVGSRTTNLDFHCQAADNAPVFQGQDWALSSLPKSAASVVWNWVPSWPTVDERHKTPSLVPIVQEIVNRSGWQSGNALAFLITGEGTRTAESYDGEHPSEAPRLHIVYGQEPVCYSLDTSAVPAAGGTINRAPAPNCGGNKYIGGTQVTLIATGSAGWSYTGWSGDLSGTANPVTIIMDGDKSITANFAQAQYLLSVTAVGSGTVTKEPDRAYYDYGQQVKLTAQGTGGSIFAGWSGDLSGTTNPDWVTINGHKAVTAAFGELGPIVYQSHVIDDDGTPPSNGNGDGFADCGERVEMTVTLYNQGTAGAEGVTGTLTESDIYVELPGNVTSSFGTIAGLASASSVTKFEFETSAATPHLHQVTFDLNVAASNGGPWPVSFSVPISCLDNAGKVDKAVVASSDDAEEQISDGTVTLLGPSLELGQDPAGPQWVGLRFQGLVIPQGATIDEAYLEFTAGQTDSGATALTIHGQNSDDALPFSSASQSSAGPEGSSRLAVSSHNISARPKIAASVSWPSVQAWSVGQSYQSPDLAPIIQEIVNRGGWKPGNSMALFIEGSGRRTAFSYDGQPTMAPRLHITFGGELICYTLGTSATPPSGGTVAPNPGANCGADKYLDGTSVELTPVPALDHSFTGWGGDLSGADIPATIVMNANKQVSAGFQAETCYTLTTGVNPGSTGTIVPNPPTNCGGGKYVAGTSVELQAVPAGAYVFDGWTGTAGPSADNPITIVVDGDKTLIANFSTCNSLTLAPDPATGGTIQADPAPDCGGDQYRSGTNVTLTAVPNPGFAFANWGGAVTGTVNPTSVSVIANMVVTASFETGSCTSLSLWANPVGAGTVSASPPPNCEGTKYMPGTSVQLTAMSRSGFKLLQWSGAASGTDNPTTIVVGIANEATAEFGLQRIESTILLPVMAR